MSGYRIYRNSVFLKQVAASATTTSDTVLAASTVYGYQASAVDNAGNESARKLLNRIKVDMERALEELQSMGVGFNESKPA